MAGRVPADCVPADRVLAALGRRRRRAVGELGRAVSSNEVYLSGIPDMLVRSGAYDAGTLFATWC
jgi:hypothetical protein